MRFCRDGDAVVRQCVRVRTKRGGKRWGSSGLPFTRPCSNDAAESIAPTGDTELVAFRNATTHSKGLFRLHVREGKASFALVVHSQFPLGFASQPARMQWHVALFCPFVYMMLYPAEYVLQVFLVRVKELVAFIEELTELFLAQVRAHRGRGSCCIFG